MTVYLFTKKVFVFLFHLKVEKRQLYSRYTDHQHEEEDDGPEGASSHLEDNLRVGDEDESGAAADHLLHLHALVVRHVAQDTERHHTG